MSFKKAIRFTTLVLLIILACALPVPIQTMRKDNLPKGLIEHFQQDTSSEENYDIKELLVH